MYTDHDNSLVNSFNSYFKLGRDFWLFAKLKATLKGKRLESREEIMRKVTAELHSIPEVLPAVVELLGEVCELPRGVF